MMRPQLKKCTMEDLDTLRAYSEAMYFETFRGMCSDADMQAYLKDAFDREKIRKELSDNAAEFYFLSIGDELSGYMKLNEAPAQSDIRDEKSLELQRIYVSKAVHGTGLGTYLLEQALRISAEKGKEYIWLGVWEKNSKAIAFYKKHGFYQIGMHPFIMGEDIQNDYIMKRDL